MRLGACMHEPTRRQSPACGSVWRTASDPGSCPSAYAHCSVSMLAQAILNVSDVLQKYLRQCGGKYCAASRSREFFVFVSKAPKIRQLVVCRQFSYLECFHWERHYGCSGSRRILRLAPRSELITSVRTHKHTPLADDSTSTSIQANSTVRRFGFCKSKPAPSAASCPRLEQNVRFQPEA